MSGSSIKFHIKKMTCWEHKITFLKPNDECSLMMLIILEAHIIKINQYCVLCLFTSLILNFLKGHSHEKMMDDTTALTRGFKGTFQTEKKKDPYTACMWGQ